MEQIVEGSYQRFSKLEPVEPPVYSRFSNDQSTGQEIVVRQVKMQTSYNHILKRINLEPVYVVEETNELVYNSKMMEKEKEYPVVWDGERFMLIKGDDGVTIYRFEEDED